MEELRSTVANLDDTRSIGKVPRIGLFWVTGDGSMHQSALRKEWCANAKLGFWRFMCAEYSFSSISRQAHPTQRHLFAQIGIIQKPRHRYKYSLVKVRALAAVTPHPAAPILPFPLMTRPFPLSPWLADHPKERPKDKVRNCSQVRFQAWSGTQASLHSCPCSHQAGTHRSLPHLPLWSAQYSKCIADRSGQISRRDNPQRRNM